MKKKTRRRYDEEAAAFFMREEDEKKDFIWIRKDHDHRERNSLPLRWEWL